MRGALSRASAFGPALLYAVSPRIAKSTFVICALCTRCEKIGPRASLLGYFERFSVSPRVLSLCGFRPSRPSFRVAVIGCCRLIVLLEQVVAEIVFEISPNAVDVVGVVLGVVVLD